MSFGYMGLSFFPANVPMTSQKCSNIVLVDNSPAERSSVSASSVSATMSLGRTLGLMRSE